MNSDLIKEIEKKLQDLYPHIVIKLVRYSNTNVRIYCNNQKLNDFNPTLLEKELAFLSDRPDFLDLFVDALKEPIEKLNRKLNKTVLHGRGSKGISIQKIKEACLNTKSIRAAARYLSVSYITFKKYASMYHDDNGINYFDKYKNPTAKGIIKNVYHSNMGRWSVQDLIDGKAGDDYPIWKFKNRLIKYGFLEEKCSVCGFEERRITDYRIPLELDFLDRNKLNKSLDNIRLLCYNCYFLNVGNLAWRRYNKSKK